MDDIGRAAKLARHDSQLRARNAQVGSVQSLACSERRQQVKHVGVEDVLAAWALRLATVLDHDAPRPVDRYAGSSILTPEVELERRDLPLRTPDGFYCGPGHLPSAGVLLGLPQPVDGAQRHQIAVDQSFTRSGDTLGMRMPFLDQ